MARITHAAAVTAVLVGALVGCSSESEPLSLGGTSWQLRQIESMDDAQGTTPVEEPASYTVTFGEDGQASFVIDCNNGTSTWEAAPSGDDGTGTLTFGPIAMTLMACPEPTIDQQVSMMLSHVRGYVLNDDGLHMSLQADGGILSWEPKT